MKIIDQTSLSDIVLEMSPLSEDQEGKLRGGFVGLTGLTAAANTDSKCKNSTCTNNNCRNTKCKNTICDNSNCANDECTNNGCENTPVTSTAAGASILPSLFINLLRMNASR